MYVQRDGVNQLEKKADGVNSNGAEQEEKCPPIDLHPSISSVS